MSRQRTWPSEYELWFDAYEAAFEAQGATEGLLCPHCGVAALVLRFVSFTHGDMAASVMPALWCSTCLHGLAPARALLPPWAVPVSPDDPSVPDYVIDVGVDLGIAATGGTSTAADSDGSFSAC